MLARVPAGDLIDRMRHEPKLRAAEVLYSDTAWRSCTVLAWARHRGGWAVLIRWRDGHEDWREYDPRHIRPGDPPGLGGVKYRAGQGAHRRGDPGRAVGGELVENRLTVQRAEHQVGGHAGVDIGPLRREERADVTVPEPVHRVLVPVARGTFPGVLLRGDGVGELGRAAASRSCQSGIASSARIVRAVPFRTASISS